MWPIKVYSEISGTLFKKCSHLPRTGLNPINVVSSENYIKALHNCIEIKKKIQTGKRKAKKKICNFFNIGVSKLKVISVDASILARDKYVTYFAISSILADILKDVVTWLTIFLSHSTDVSSDNTGGQVRNISKPECRNCLIQNH